LTGTTDVGGRGFLWTLDEKLHYCEEGVYILLTQGYNKVVCHIVALPFTLKSILRQKKKNYGNTQILFHHAKISSLQKNPLKRNQNPSRNIITLL
jgi:hypothetical protein